MKTSGEMKSQDLALAADPADPFANPSWSAGTNGVQRCLCAAGIEPRCVDPLNIIIPVADAAAQELWAHVQCLRTAVHPSTPLAIFRRRE